MDNVKVYEFAKGKINVELINLEDIIEDGKEVWDLICMYFEIPESLLEKYIYKINFDIISKFQTLSGEFIKKYSSKLNMSLVSKYQLLTQEFIKENMHLLDAELIYTCQNITEDFREYLRQTYNIIEPAIEEYESLYNGSY